MKGAFWLMGDYPDDINPFDPRMPWNSPGAIYCEVCEDQEVMYDPNGDDHSTMCAECDKEQ